MRPWRLIKITLALVAIAGAGLAAYRYGPTSTSETPQRLGAVERLDLTQKVTIAGGVVPKRMVLISAPYNGYVNKVYVAVGDTVKPGNPVVSLSQSVVMNGEDVFPLRSPIQGQVVQVLRQEGEFVNSASQDSSTLVRIDDLSKFFVDGVAPEIDVAKLALGQPVEIRVVALPQKTFKGKIVDMARSSRSQQQWDRTNVEFPLRVEILDPDPQIRSGMSAVMDVTVQEAAGVLALRHEFIQKDGKQYFVTLADGTRRDIEVGMQNEEAFEIKSGLSEGQSVRQVDFLQMAEKSGGKNKSL